ncbi:MAG: hypothetical protein LBE83_06365 [Propionibacteriaceae bacterium]|jgi:hypothetical protein|nr:hypothetical protein [Propionibacteriaceae bacterium]
MSVPWPAGSPQNPPSIPQTLTYLDQLGAWLEAQRSELDRLDKKMQQGAGELGVHDIAMTLTVWQAINQRYTDLLKTWDSGRVTEVELKRLAVMTWANLNDPLTPGVSLSTGGGLALSLPEACRMLDALIAQLSSRHQLSPMPTQVSTRIVALRAQVERIKDQAGLDPPAVRQLIEPKIADLVNDVRVVIEKADRGADIGGILGPAEVKAAQLERDLIVGHAERAQLVGKVQDAKNKRAGLKRREQTVAALVVKTQAEVDPAPKYAVPQVDALGEVPTTAAELTAYLARLDQVNAALEIVQKANQAAAGRLEGVVRRFQVAKAAKAGLADPLSITLADQLEQLFITKPAPIDVIEPLLGAYEATGRKP